VFLRVDFWFLLIGLVLGTEHLATGSPWGTPAIPKVSLESVERVGKSIEVNVKFSRGLSSSRLPGQNQPDRFLKPVPPVYPQWAVERSFWTRESRLSYGFSCSKVERFLRCFGLVLSRRPYRNFLVKTSLTGFPCLREAKSLKVGLTGFRNRPDQFWLPAAVSSYFPLHVLCSCWLNLAPRSSSTSIAMWIRQEKFTEVSEWFWVHRPNSCVEFLSAPIHSPYLVRRSGPSKTPGALQSAALLGPNTLRMHYATLEPALASCLK
jgi:hypothetical protein